MTDLDVSMGVKEELSAPTDDDKRLVDSIKNISPPVEEGEPADDLPEGGMTFGQEKVLKEIEDELELKDVIDEKKIFKQKRNGLGGTILIDAS